MIQRAALLLLTILAATGSAGCGGPSPSESPGVQRIDALAVLPKVVRGRPIGYTAHPPWETDTGTATQIPPNHIQKVVQAAGMPDNAVSEIVGFPKAGEDLLISAWSVRGLDATRLIDPLIANWAFEDETRWMELIEGKQVTRAVPSAVDRADAIYVYAVGDTAFLIVADRADAAEILAALP